MDADEFRALARSSPWLWTTVEFDWRPAGTDDRPVRAWIRRPGRMRVEAEGRPPQIVDDTRTLGHDHGVFGASTDGSPVSRPTYRVPQDPLAPQPARRGDGLVERRPDDFSIVYDDPMYENYRWIAMLDPVELADRRDGDDDEAAPLPSSPIEVLELTETERLGRPTVDAVVRPTTAYDPRCACCPLLHSAITDAYENVPASVIGARTYASAYRIQLDRATGICVQLSELGGDHDGAGFDVTLLSVDADLAVELFG